MTGIDAKIVDYVKAHRRGISEALTSWDKAIGDDGCNDDEHDIGGDMANILQGLVDIMANDLLAGLADIFQEGH